MIVENKVAKQTTTFGCKQCGYTSVKWYGCCPACRAWETFVEWKESKAHKKDAAERFLTKEATLVPLGSVSSSEAARLCSSCSEWDRVLGGGIVPGSFIIVTGDPGVGKSTLLLQIAAQLADSYTVFYFSTEESLQQVKMRAQRLNCMHDGLLFSDQPQYDDIVNAVDNGKPDIIIIDSIQNCFVSDSDVLPGTIGQLRELAHRCMRLAKDRQIAVIVTGHITKDGAMAGPKTLEHMVDVVLYVHGEDQGDIRILRAVKNRFGGVNELGFFRMDEGGLTEVANINQQLLAGIASCPGSVLVSYQEGSRPLLFEMQALVNPTKFGNPQRVIAGVDYNQVILIAAILEKYLKIAFGSYDIFFKLSGGLKIKDSSCDLAIALALLSSFFQKTIGEKIIALGEITLSGHIKPVAHIESHIKEAERFGIEDFVVSSRQQLGKERKGIRAISSVYELVTLFE